MRWRLTLVIFGITFWVGAQNISEPKTLTQELHLVVENDVWISLLSDQYYSSGIFGSYRHLLDSTKYPKKVINSTRSYGLSQRIYTARLIDWELLEDLDRPYAGLISLFAQQQFYLENNQYIGVKLELGWMGPSSFTGDIHESWHGFFGLPTPRGWFAEVNDAPVINLFLDHGFQVARANGIELQADIILESNLAMGTIFNSIGEHIVFRVGKLKPFPLSSFFGNTLGTKKPRQKSRIAVEAYFFYSPGVEYVFYDGTLQGGLIERNPSIFTKDPRQWRSQHRAGLNFRYGVFDFNFIAFFQSRETDGVRRHQYAAIELKQRF